LEARIRYNIGMKKLVLVALFLFGCGSEGHNRVDVLSESEERVVDVAGKLASRIVYIKDRRTDSCFAISYLNTHNGWESPAMATVDCGKIAEDLIVAKIAK
jgi:hypothetical protein